MGTLASIIGVILLVLAGILVFVVGLGLLFVLGILLGVLALIAVIASLFGACEPLSVLGPGWNLRHESLIQSFHTCLVEQVPDDCRKSYTTWDKDRLELIQHLADTARRELGHRKQGSSSQSSLKTEIVNGEQTTVIDGVSDFEKKTKVREHYVLKRQDGEMKIEDLSWQF